ncbi:MAG: flavodoxin family protein [Candidatus Omnitrophica bacterium]|nr:flavodoxin family protein [Candidatus Omnitrophota bacterium]MBU1924099.1 flavodoxin family protein [Candidatus Omnitrophota bacterium]
MKVVVFNGSPKADRGNTHVIVSALLEGMAKAGASTENVLLAQKKINHCIGCFTCWTKTPGECVLEDDMEELLKKYMSSDIVIMASPLYVDHVTGIMKDFMDRSLPLVCPQFEMGDVGQTRHVSRYEKYPSIIWVSNCGFPEKDQFAVLQLACERDIRNNKADIIAQIYRSQGPLLTSDDPELELALNRYKELLRQAGAEIVLKRKIPADLQEELEKPLIPEDEYSKGVNASWNSDS